jgi:tetratricopeptide (TPR) repeat protein
MLLALMLSTLQAHAKLNNEVAFYIDTYGELSVQQDPRVAEAQRVFKKVLSVADRNSKHLAKLVVINNKTHAWAIALPAGHIVLSRQVLDIVHRDADIDLAQARLAFVLGHELAHLANDDFWHHEVENFMQDTSDAQKIAEYLNQHSEEKQAELAADDKGYIFAAMAGYPVDRLLSNRKPENPGVNKPVPNQDFFTFWMQQTNAQTSPSHPTAKDRAELLRQRLHDLNQKLAFFRFGSRLAHFGRCNDAIYFLKEFQKVFPGRSVLNNLGLCFLQQARSQMSEQQLTFYWLPLSLDTRSRAVALTRESVVDLSAPKQFLKNHPAESVDVAGYLEDAVNVLSLAVEKDALYVPARINLAIAYLYQGKPHQARAVLAEARQQSDPTLQIEMLDALALYEQTDADIDLWATALKKLTRLEKTNQSMSLLYNHARLLSVRPRKAQAQDVWNRLRTKAGHVPVELRQELCSKQTIDSLASCLLVKEKKSTRPNWNWLFTTSSAPLSVSDREKLRVDWSSIGFDWASADLHGYIHQRNDGDIEMLEMSQAIQIQVLKGNPVADITKISTYCKHEMIKRKMDADEVWTCDNWAVLVSNQQAKEIWYIQK